MFDLITQSMLFLLETLKNIVGNYGWAIISLTVLVRLVLWPVSKSQMKSMKTMQELQPKMKLLQERYKTDPQKLQGEMMKLYKENKFNPLGGCLPMLIQLPLFIGLYWAISNPMFMAAGDPTWFTVHLNHTGIVSHAGQSFDGNIALSPDANGGFMGSSKDRLVALPGITVIKKDGEKLDVKIPDANKALTVQPETLRGGVPVNLSTNFERLGLDGYEGYLKTIEVTVVNNTTKELERITFEPKGKESRVSAKLQSEVGKSVPHMDVLVLIILFAMTMIASQKMMSGQTQPSGNEQQQMMMKFLPIMFTVMLFFIPLPAGVLLYMDTNSLFQILQTWMFQLESKRDDAKKPPSQAVLDITPDTP